MKRHKASLHFLIIEDVKEHALLIKEAVHAHDFLHDISSVNGSTQAWRMLYEFQQEDYLPHIIILDLNVGGMDARNFLKKMSEEETFASIPVLVLSSTGSEQDRDYVSAFPNCMYIVKPAGILEFMNLINFICNFWSKNKTMPDYNSLRDRFRGEIEK